MVFWGWGLERRRPCMNARTHLTAERRVFVVVAAVDDVANVADVVCFNLEQKNIFIL